MSTTRFSITPNIQFAFGDLENPWPLHAPFKKEERAKIKLVHGTNIVVINNENKFNETFTDADGAITLNKNIGLAVSWADCVPILAAKYDGTGIAALHAGWRGTRDGIAVQLEKSLMKLGEQPNQWNVLIGPSIRKCCYEVSADVAKTFNASSRYIDLAEINAHQLQQSNFRSIEIQSPCTCCSLNHAKKPLYFSYRRDKTIERQWAVIQIISS